jgi:tetratricopeptide (TPR) repeat protein
MNVQQNPMQQILTTLKAGDAAAADGLLDELLVAAPSHGPALVLKARLARQSGQYDAAAALLGRARESVGDHPQWLSESGYLALATGDAHEAIDRFEALVQKLPDYADGHFNLAHAYREQGRFESAIVSFERALELNVAQPHEAHTELGSTLLQVRRESDAQPHFERALEIHPGYSRALFGLGTVCAAHGDFASAQVHFRRALDDDPSFVEAFQQIAAHRRFDSADDSDIVAMRSALDAPGISAYQREKLEFSLGKAMDDCGHYDEAFAHYDVANRLKRSRGPAYDRARQEDLVAQVIETFDERRAALDPPPSASDRPIVIVGMPRSGTTLLETMLARHPEVDAGGELSFFERVVRPALAPYPAGLDRASTDTLEELASLYLEELRRAGDAAHITDKYPANFVHLGTIALLFPNASLIHCTRHPLDTCLSIFFQDFSYGNDYANDLDDVAHYLGQYQRLMAHWTERLGERLLHIQYEDVVDEQDIALLRMLDHCDLPYDERCLDPAFDPDVVSTLSRWQVRQPIYASSKARWRHYRGHVERLAEALRVALD